MNVQIDDSLLVDLLSCLRPLDKSFTPIEIIAEAVRVALHGFISGRESEMMTELRVERRRIVDAAIEKMKKPG